MRYSDIMNKRSECMFDKFDKVIPSIFAVRNFFDEISVVDRN